MFKSLKLFASGLCIGITSITPGMSSRKMTTSLSLNTQITESLNHVLRAPLNSKKQLYTLISLGLGIATAVKVGASTIDFWLIQHYQPTIWFLIGIMSASIPVLRKKYRYMKMSPSKFIALITPLLIIIAFSLIKVPSQYGIIQNTPLLLLLTSGFIIGSAIVTPGISATPILLLIGTYSTLIQSITTIKLKIIIIVGIGAIMGMSIFSKVITYWIKNSPASTYYALIGVILGNISAIYPGIGFGILATIPGYFIAKKLG